MDIIPSGEKDNFGCIVRKTAIPFSRSLFKTRGGWLLCDFFVETWIVFSEGLSFIRLAACRFRQSADDLESCKRDHT